MDEGDRGREGVGTHCCRPALMSSWRRCFSMRAA